MTISWKWCTKKDVVTIIEHRLIGNHALVGIGLRGGEGQLDIGTWQDRIG